MPKDKSFSYGGKQFSITDDAHGIFRLVDPVTGETKRCQIYAFNNELQKSQSIFLKIEQAEPLAKKAGLKLREKVTKQKAAGGKKVGKKKIRDLINLAMKNGVSQEDIEKLGFEVEEKPKKAAKKTTKKVKAEEPEEADEEDAEEADEPQPKKKSNKPAKKTSKAKKQSKKVKEPEEDEADEEEDE